MRVCYVVNPIAGHGRGRRNWERVAKVAAEYGEVAYRFTEAKGEGVQLARQAAEQGFDCVVAMGGDGTLSEVANGLLGTQACLGLIASGTGNDFARAVDVPLDPAAAARLVYQGVEHQIDLVQVKGGPAFINVAGVGFDAEVARWVNEHPKYLGGTITYLMGVVGTLIRYRSPVLEMELDGKHLMRTSILTALGNAQCYGGGMRITPDAKVDDGWIDVCVGGDVSVGELAGLLPKMYKGAHVGHPKVEIFRAKHVEITAKQPVAMHADGEVLGNLPLTVDLLPEAIKFKGPAAAVGFAHPG